MLQHKQFCIEYSKNQHNNAVIGKTINRFAEKLWMLALWCVCAQKQKSFDFYVSRAVCSQFRECKQKCLLASGCPSRKLPVQQGLENAHFLALRQPSANVCISCRSRLVDTHGSLLRARMQGKSFRQVHRQKNVTLVQVALHICLNEVALGRKNGESIAKLPPPLHYG